MAQKFLTLGSRELYNLDYNHSDSPNGGGANLSALLADANAMFTEIYTLGSLTLALRFPTLVDLAGFNWHLQASSPLKTAGVTIAGIPLFDYEGNAVSATTPSIGAYEYH